MRLLYYDHGQFRLKSKEFEPEKLLDLPHFREFNFDELIVEYELPTKRSKLSGPVIETQPFPVVHDSFLDLLSTVGFERFISKRLNISGVRSYSILLHKNFKKLDASKTKAKWIVKGESVSHFKEIVVSEPLEKNDHIFGFIEASNMVFISEELAQQILDRFKKKEIGKLKLIETEKTNELEHYSRLII